MKLKEGMELKHKLPKYFLYVELAGLYIIAFSMPAMESLKWCGFALFVLGGIGRMTFCERIERRRPTPFEWFLILMFGVALLSTVVNWPLPSGVTGIKDLFFYLLVGWLISISRFSNEQIKFFLFFLIAGVLLGLGLSAVEFFNGRNPFLEFKSIPNLNRSVIYLLITIFTMCGMLFDNGGHFSKGAKVCTAICLAVFLVSLIIMGSRTGIIAFLTGAVLFFISFFGHRRIRIYLPIGFMLLLIVSAGLYKYMTLPAVKVRLERFHHYFQIIANGSSTDLGTVSVSNRMRIDYLRVAWAQITQKENLLLGTGPATFKYIKIDELEFTPPLSEYKKSWNKLSHAHNEYMNRWVAQGLLGLGVHLSFLIYLGRYLFRHRPKRGRIQWLWVACLGTLNTAVVAGFFNTVFTNEMAWQAMILIGFIMQWEAHDKRKNP